MSAGVAVAGSVAAPAAVVWGAGAWGTAVALRIAARRPVLLWARDAAQAAAMHAQREQARYLPGVRWSDDVAQRLRITADAADAADAVAAGAPALLAVPMAALRETLQRQPAGARVGWLCKGFERDSGLLPHEVLAQCRPDLSGAAVVGPSFALEVARAQPTALLAASAHAGCADALQHLLHGGALRVYTSCDVVGAEVGAALKNVMATATGIADGLALGENARAALVTRGLAEMTRLGVALGAQPATFMGLSGLGDLVLTATGSLSRNRRVGVELAGGRPLADVLAGLGHVAEGVGTATTARRRADALGIEMPITAAVDDVLGGRLVARDALTQLLERQARGEQDGWC